MNIEKEKAQINKQIEKLHASKAEFIQKARERKRAEAQQIMVDAGITDAPVNDELDFNTLTDIEVKYNDIIGALYERRRQLDIAEKRERLTALPASLEKLTNDISALETKLTNMKSERQAIDNEIRQSTTQIEFATKPDRAVYYKRQVPILMDGHVHVVAKQQALDYILNY